MTNEDLYDYWFADGENPQPWWFEKDAARDEQLKARFASRIPANVSIDPKTTRERLSLILLFDQVPRNSFRGDPRSFAYDPRALTLAKEGIAAGDLDRTSVVEALFLLLPLEHSENLADQRECVRRMEELERRAPGHLKDFAREILEFAKKHERTVVRFGRFPHRNRVLGRESTPEELAFLEQPGSSF